MELEGSLPCSLPATGPVLSHMNQCFNPLVYFDYFVCLPFQVMLITLIVAKHYWIDVKKYFIYIARNIVCLLGSSVMILRYLF
jgi:hypothetical protein